MSNFVVSARKYRPDQFSSVVGQPAITQTLKAAIRGGQLAQSFLFCGPRGVGKTSCARIFAKTINCFQLDHDGEACGKCTSCLSFAGGTSLNVHELDAASNNTVDDIRSLTEQVRYPPQAGKYKVYIIDEVHMLSTSAFNAFLKTLEEPPAYAIFILATTEKNKIIPTILSRCQIFDFHRIGVDDIAQHLALVAGYEHVNFQRQALELIAQKSDGALRDALSTFDQLAIFTGNNITYESVLDNLNILDHSYYFSVVVMITQQDIPGLLLLFNTLLRNGFDGIDFVGGLSHHFRNLLVSKDEQTLSLIEDSESVRVAYQEQSKMCSVSFLLSALNITSQTEINYKVSKNPRLQVELALMKLCHIEEAFRVKHNEATEDEKKNFNPPVVEVSSEQSVSKKEPSVRIRIPKLSELAAHAVPTGKESDVQSFPLRPLAENELIQQWNKYANKLEEEGKLGLQHLLTAHLPRLELGNVLKAFVENSIQKDMLQAELPSLTTFLRDNLKTHLTVQIEINVSKEPEKKVLFSAEERFLHLAERNPNLWDLKAALKLDLDR